MVCSVIEIVCTELLFSLKKKIHSSTWYNSYTCLMEIVFQLQNEKKNSEDWLHDNEDILNIVNSALISG